MRFGPRILAIVKRRMTRNSIESLTTSDLNLKGNIGYESLRCGFMHLFAYLARANGKGN